ncbi:MAG: hypothetical protein FJ149_08460 [Euryarchaeota archaeon]|nr:hypothetical protein [Euryarchaeota archaeon]
MPRTYIATTRVEVGTMGKDDVGDVLKEKSLELKKMFKDIKAVLEQWKFSVEESKEGLRIELHAVALIKKPKKEE